MPSRYSGNATFFDTRAYPNQPASNGTMYYISAAGVLGMYSGGGSIVFGTAAIPLNSWVHIAYVLYNGTWSAYINGIVAGTGSNSGFGTSVTSFSLGVDSQIWSLSSYKYNGSAFQPMVTGKAKYTTNFTPANDLSVGASTNPVLFFLNPGVSGGFQDLATGSSMTMGGTAVTQSIRYLTY
jgi:hypothetical protein